MPPEPASVRERVSHLATRNLCAFAMVCDKSPPDKRWKPSAFHVILGRVLYEAVILGKKKRLIINVPPRHGKSRMTSIEAVAMLFGHRPQAEVAVTSYGQNLALDASRAVRERIQKSETYRKLFPGTRIRSDSAAVEEWHTTKGGRMQAVGVQGGLTGKGVDCLVGSTILETDRGQMTIAQLWALRETVKVLAYSHASKRFCWRTVTAVANRSETRIYRITTIGGRMVEASASHPFFTGDGYQRAATITAGTRLLCALPIGESNTGIRICESGQTGSNRVLLRAGMLGAASERNYRAAGDTLQELREDDSQQHSLLLHGMPEGEVRRTESPAPPRPAKALPELQQDVSSVQFEIGALRAAMPANGARRANGSRGESSLEGRRIGQAILPAQRESLPVGAPAYSSPGWDGMRLLRPNGQASRSPHQHECQRQSLAESGNALPALPQSPSCNGTFAAEYDTVALVEEICRDEMVWNLQVEGTENFFANGILSHNCLIIDDPHKDRADAESETSREKVWDWYKSTAYTRLSPGGVIIVIMTRWHPDDLTGRLLDPKRTKEFAEAGAEEEIFEVIDFPALAEHKDPMGRPEGEPLWPERWTAKVLQARKVAVGSYEWDALFRCKPRVRSANYGLLDKIKYCTMADVPDIELPRVWDLAVTNKQESDFNVGTRGGVDRSDPKRPKIYIVHMHRQRSRWMATKQAIKSLAEKDGQGTRLRLEGVGGFEGLVDEVKEMLRGKNIVTMNKPTTDKFTRALAWIAILEAGDLYLVEGPWNTDFTDELVAFPNGEHDDQVDTVSALFEWQNKKTKLLMA